MGYISELDQRRFVAQQKFAQRAVTIAQRDGIPEAGTDEYRLHGPLKNDPYITSDKVMVSFRSAKGQPIALLEQLWCDGERTHITGRSAIVVNPMTGYIHDANLFFQSSPGDYTSVISRFEVEIDQNRKDIRKEKINQQAKMNAHVVESMKRRDQNLRELVRTFEQAAAVIGVSLSPYLASNRNLFRIHPTSQVARRGEKAEVGFPA